MKLVLTHKTNIPINIAEHGGTIGQVIDELIRSYADTNTKVSALAIELDDDEAVIAYDRLERNKR
jgi:hypothetical protein